MTGGTAHEQIERTLQLKEEQLAYWGIALFGDEAQLQPITKRFSLWQ